MAGGFRLHPASWACDQAQLRAVREDVFIRGQRIPPGEEWDALDAISNHVLALDDAGNAIGCARLTPERRIGRMAVRAEWRGRGVGMALLRHCIAEARAQGWTEVSLSAQEHAIPFYARAGFTAYGPSYPDAGIPHQMMRRRLAEASDDAPRPAPERTPPDALLAEDQPALAQALLRLVLGAGHTVDLYLRTLEPGWLEQPALLEALRALAVRGRGSRLRLLVQDPQPALREGHRLLPLIQRLPSIVSLRQPVEDADLQYPGAFAVNDRGGWLLRPLATRPEARGSTRDPGPARQLTGYFEQVWARARAVSELLPLQL